MRISEKTHRNKAVSQIIGILLLIILTLILTTTLLFTSPTYITPNTYKKIIYSGRVYNGANSHSTQIVEIVNEGGDCLNLKNTIVYISIFHNNKVFSEKLWGFPISKNSSIKNWSGDDLIDRREPRFQRTYGHSYLGKLTGNGIWCVGDIIGFRIKTTSIKLVKGDRIKVTFYRGNTPIMVTNIDY